MIPSMIIFYVSLLGGLNVGVLITLFILIMQQGGRIMADLTKLTQDVSDLSAAIDTLIAAQAGAGQPAVDALATTVVTLKDKVVAATPA